MKSKMFLRVIFASARPVFAFLLVALLTPFAYFVWRAGQPMGRPEFHDLTYYDLLSERLISASIF